MMRYWDPCHLEYFVFNDSDTIHSFLVFLSKESRVFRAYGIDISLLDGVLLTHQIIKLHTLKCMRISQNETKKYLQNLLFSASVLDEIMSQFSITFLIPTNNNLTVNKIKS